MNRLDTALPVLDAPPDRFAARLGDAAAGFRRLALATLQLNLGKMCNLACHHCHVEAGPNRTEIMQRETLDAILAWLDRHADDHGIATVDLTGGAPEMNPHFRDAVVAFRERDLHVLDRCNLTILLEPGYADLPRFLADHGVEIVASLPCYLQDNVDKQRGKGVYDGSIEALKRLNAAGYGREGGGLKLDLVYNPVGYGLPPAQEALEGDYKTRLAEDWGIGFNRLWTITNMPIKRFEHALRRDGQYEAYLDKLEAAHRDANLESVMCRSLVSVGWRGTVYDCDFNQMLQMPVAGDDDTDASDADPFGPGHDEHVVERDAPKLWDFTPGELIGRRIRTGSHCFGCTAGAGSSCTGSLS